MLFFVKKDKQMKIKKEFKKKRKLKKEKENGLSCDATIYHSRTLLQSNLKK